MAAQAQRPGRRCAADLTEGLPERRRCHHATIRLGGASRAGTPIERSVVDEPRVQRTAFREKHQKTGVLFYGGRRSLAHVSYYELLIGLGGDQSNGHQEQSVTHTVRSCHAPTKARVSSIHEDPRFSSSVLCHPHLSVTALPKLSLPLPSAMPSLTAGVVAHGRLDMRWR